MAGTMRHLVRAGLGYLIASALLFPAGGVHAKTSDGPACADPLSCYTFEKPVTPQNVYKQMAYDRTIDGDTFVASGKTIRVWGIDAPERGDPVFLASKLYLEVILENADALQCKFIDVDRYSRDVMHCQTDGHDIGSMMVQMGVAKDYRKYSGGFYEDDERLAREEGRGVWKKDPADQ
jgi:endonuclease YncB( thermonuclease family)